MSFQEKNAGNQTIIFVLAILVVFLVLAAQYESWTMPAAVIAVVPLAVLGVVVRVDVAWSRQQHLHADWNCVAGCPGQQKCHFDRGVCQRTTTRRPFDPRSSGNERPGCDFGQS